MKKTVIFALMLMYVAILSKGFAMQTYAQPLKYANHTTIITPQSDIIEWRYKTVNGKLYRRQYNCTQSKWIGKWELVP